MKKKHLALIILTLILSAFCLIGLVACGDNGSSGTKTITISIDESAEVGAPVKLEKSASFSPFLQDKIKYEFVGENTCYAQFSHTLDNKNKWWDTYIIASKSGSVSIKLTYIEDGEVVAESNTVSITFYANTISTVEELKAIAGTTKSYELTCDIDLDGAIWNSFDFAGNLSGAGHSIKNFVINSNTNNIGLFSNLTGNIFDLNVVDVTVTARGGQSNLGIIAGTNKGQISNCSVFGTVEAKTSSNVGGLVGNNASGAAIKNCTNYASVSANDYTGGIVGVSAGTLDFCINEGTIVGGSYVGGIAGDISGTADTLENRGDISASGNRVGGIFGNATGETKERKNLATVTSSGDYVGGIVGYSQGSSSGSSNSGNVNGRYYVGGLFGYTNGNISGQINTVTVTGRAYLGGIVGYCTGILTDCENHGDIVSTGTITEEGTTRSYLGGLAGYCGGVVDGKNTVNITGTGARVGGLVGHSTGAISNSQNDGIITGYNSVGGLGGNVNGAISDSTNNGDIIGESYVGGLAGYMYGSKVEYCTNNGLIKGSDYTGGLLGYVYNTIDIIASENKVDVFGANWTGGYVGYLRTTATIRGSINNNAITGKAIVGGIIGGGDSTTLIDCENYGTITASGMYIESSTAYSYIGGLAGKCNTITNGKNDVDIFGTSERVGGLAGYVIGSITNSQNNGNITGKNQTGGLAGYIGGAITGSNSYGEIIGEKYTGGLVGYFNGSKIDESTNAGVVSGDDYTGGLTGYSYNSLEITASANNVNVTGDNYTGGYIGYARTTATIRNAVNNNTITGKAYVGGIVGYGVSTTLHYCENYGEINSTATITESDVAYSYVGGLAGYCASINNGKNTVNITGTGYRVGGLAGYVNGAITNSQNEGDVSGNNYTGGLGGYVTGNIVNCNNAGAVTGKAYTGGLAGYFWGSKLETTKNEGTINGDNYCGGLLGYSYNVLEASASENKADVKGGNYTGGYIGYTRTTSNLREAVNRNKVEGKAYIGGIVGCGYSSNLYYCENYGTIVSTATITESDVAYSYVGGLAGYCALISNCKNTVNITGSGARVGGLAGYVTGTISSSQNDGNVAGKNYTGGLAGYITGNITECSNNGDVIGENYTGGITGYFSASKVDSFINVGDVTGSNYVGSFIGYSYNTLEISASENTANITSSGDYVGSLIGQVITDTTIRTTKNTGKTNNGYRSFIGYYAGTIKGLPCITDANVSEIKEDDIFTAESLEIAAYDFISKNALSVSLEIKEGTQTAGSILVLSAKVVDEYGNTDVRYIVLKIYGTPIITQSSTTVSIKKNPTYVGCTVAFDLNGANGNAPASQIITDTESLQYPSTPTREGYIFAGWYLSPNGTGQPYDFTQLIEGDITLYAKWIKIELTALTVNVSYSESYAAGAEKTYAFVPLVSGNITITTKRNSGDIDGYLLDSNQTQIAADTNSNADISITYSVSAGELYYIKIKSYKGSGNTPILITGETVSDGGVTLYFEHAKDVLNITAKDSFNNDLNVIVILKTGTFSVGNYVTYTITATDKVGNTCAIDTDPILVTE